MSAKADRLRRLLAVRESREQLAKLELQRCIASSRAVERAIADQDSFCLHARHTGDAALRSGDQEEWLISQAEYEVAGWNKSGLEDMLGGLNGELARAKERYANLYRECEQSKILLEDVVQTDIVAENRRSQMEADSWFLSQRLGRRLRRA